MGIGGRQQEHSACLRNEGVKTGAKELQKIPGQDSKGKQVLRSRQRSGKSRTKKTKRQQRHSTPQKNCSPVVVGLGTKKGMGNTKIIK